MGTKISIVENFLSYFFCYETILSDVLDQLNRFIKDLLCPLTEAKAAEKENITNRTDIVWLDFSLC